MATETVEQDTQQNDRTQESGVRFVRTQEGVKRYGKPIGSVIVSNKNMQNVKYLGATKHGWGIFKGTNGKQYQIGKQDGVWIALPYGDMNRKHSIVEGGALSAVLKALNRRSGNASERREDTDGEDLEASDESESTQDDSDASTKKGSNAKSTKSKTSKTSKSKGKKKEPPKGEGSIKGPNRKGVRSLMDIGFGSKKASSTAEGKLAEQIMQSLAAQKLVRKDEDGKWIPAGDHNRTSILDNAVEDDRMDDVLYRWDDVRVKTTANELMVRADALFAETKGLDMAHPFDTPEADMEMKVRLVRTARGAARYGLPIGSVIGSGGNRLANLKVHAPVYKDWDLVSDKKGNKYDVGKHNDKWGAYKHNDRSKPVVSGNSKDHVYEKLDEKAGGKVQTLADRTRKRAEARRDGPVVGDYAKERKRSGVHGYAARAIDNYNSVRRSDDDTAKMRAQGKLERAQAELLRLNELDAANTETRNHLRGVEKAIADFKRQQARGMKINNRVASRYGKGGRR